jgi:hypothetical protein
MVPVGQPTWNAKGTGVCGNALAMAIIELEKVLCRKEW